MATVTAEFREWRKLATETTEELKVAKADVVLQSGLPEAAQKDMDAQTAKCAELQEQLATTNTKFLQLLTKHGKLNSELSLVKMQHAAGADVSNSLMSVGEARERSATLAKRTRLCKGSFTTPSTVSFSALLTERDDFEKCYEALTLENHCVPGLAAAAKELCEKLADRGKKTLRPVLLQKVKKGSALLWPINERLRSMGSSQRQRMHTHDLLLLLRVLRLMLLAHEQT